ncbi:histidine phosphatase family protein [Carnobacterium gallinarum]|uniref:histidine phosphatase family protein n=1 Tax=Carnobacterium gallinarum TaxID=2749 RepID=UPI00054E9346|nr:histidine phosphatase family protein [Carnobacterium gallinarum]
MTTTLYFVRHGQTLWNLEERMQGQLNSALTNLGIQQAQALSNFLPEKKIDCCYVSTSLRAIQTAQLITTKLAIPINESSQLQEIKMGPWEGQSKLEIQQNYPHSWEQFWHAPHDYQPNGNGENFQQLQQRSVAKIKKICHENNGKTILIVSHRITIKVLLAHFLEQPLMDLWKNGDILPTSLSCVEISSDHTNNVTLYSDISHYQKNKAE